MDQLADQLVMGDLSRYNQAVQGYMQNGLSQEAAERQAGWDMAKDLTQTAVQGGLRGIAFSAGGMAYGAGKQRVGGAYDVNDMAARAANGQIVNGRVDYTDTDMEIAEILNEDAPRKPFTDEADGGIVEETGENIKPDVSLDSTTTTAGNFNSSNLTSIQNLNDFKTRIPSNAQQLPWRIVEGGATEGVRYKWVDEQGNVWNVRAYSIDPHAPADSNASKGWIYRVEVRWGGTGKKYYMDSSGKFHPDNVMNPNSPMYDERIANDTHIIFLENR